ncbi:MAG: sulfatase-like hydrolase/transferase, partial [Planctomycetota bacterium]
KIPGVGNGKSGKRNLGEDNLNKDYGTYYWTGQDQRVPQRELTGDDSMLIMKRATRFIEQCASDKKPFFAVIWFHAPHLPVVADEDHRNLYPRHPFGSLGKNYAGCLSALDDSMGLLHNELKRHSMFDNTMLWYCSDNGPESSSKKGPGRAEPFRGRKRDLYEGGVRVPGFVVWPHKIKKPFSTDVPCVTSDYFPTIHDVLGLDLPKRPYDGMSLLPLLEDRSKKRNRAIGFQSKKVQVWNDDRFKLVINKGKEELYDVANDLAESANLIEQHPEIAKNMKAEMMAWIESCKKSESGQDYRSGE